MTNKNQIPIFVLSISEILVLSIAEVFKRGKYKNNISGNSVVKLNK